MMIKFKVTIAALLLTFSAAVMAQGNGPSVTIFEALLKNFSMAESTNGAIGFRQCDDCDYVRLRVTPRSTFMIDGRYMRFQDFKKAIVDFESTGQIEVNVNVGRDDTSGTLATVFIYTQ